MSFYLLKSILSDEFSVSPPWDSLGAAIAAVIVVNVIIVMYVYKAFQEDKKEHSD